MKENELNHEAVKKKKPKREQEEEQTPSKKKQKKLRKERESSHDETSAKKKKGSSKKQTKRQREISSEGKLAVNKDEEEEERKKKQKEMDAEKDSQSENAVRAAEHRTKTVDASFRLLVPSKDIGKIIGKQGFRIQKLREETDAHIKIGDAIMNLEERVVWIAPKEDTLISQSAAQRAFLAVATLLIRDEEFSKIRFLVPGSQAEVVTGEGGITLEKIREDTGATVNLFSKDGFPLCTFACETDKILQLEGKVSQVQEALELVMAKLREIPPQSGDVEWLKGCRKAGDFMTTVQIRVPNKLIGKLIGKEGSTISQMKHQCRVSIAPDANKEDGVQASIVHLEGRLSQVTMAQTLLQVVFGIKAEG